MTYFPPRTEKNHCGHGHAFALVWSSAYGCYLCPKCYREIVSPAGEKDKP